MFLFAHKVDDFSPFHASFYVCSTYGRYAKMILILQRTTKTTSLFIKTFEMEQNKVNMIYICTRCRMKIMNDYKTSTYHYLKLWEKCGGWTISNYDHPSKISLCVYKKAEKDFWYIWYEYQLISSISNNISLTIILSEK